MRTFAILSSLLLLAACGDDTTTDDTGRDARGDSASDADSPDTDTCAARCDGLCVDLTTDRTHCGACDSRCVDAANAMGACVEGSCEQQCEDGFADCDGDVSNGCEASLSSLESCGACGAICEPVANSTPTCTMGTCAAVCSSTFADCDDELSNGCEADLTDIAQCGACGTVCAPEPSSTPVCLDAFCAIECDAGFADCEAAPGCESELATSLAHCGACGQECVAGANASPVCSDRICGFVCDDGFGACEDLPATEGCTTDLSSSHAHCGGCDNACVVRASATAAACSEGECVNVCEGMRGDCDDDVNNGCETATHTSTEHCGACDNACDALSFCLEGACTRRKVAFVTSTRTAPSTFGSLAGADAICAARATAAGLPGTFLAWLSDSTGSPSSRFSRSANGYVRPDGTVLANSWSDLVDGAIRARFDRNEFGDEVMSEISTPSATCNRSHVVTASRTDGTWFTGFDCNGWSGGGSGIAGETTTTTGRWSAGCGGGYICSSAMRLYCFEQ